MNQRNTLARTSAEYAAVSVAARPGQRAAPARARIAYALRAALAVVAAWLERNL